jgi:hypothetical protein
VQARREQLAEALWAMGRLRISIPPDAIHDVQRAVQRKSQRATPQEAVAQFWGLVRTGGITRGTSDADEDVQLVLLDRIDGKTQLLTGTVMACSACVLGLTIVTYCARSRRKVRSNFLPI